MKDARIEKLAKNLIQYSVSLQPGEKVLIEAIGLEYPLVKALVKEAYAAKGIPFVTVKDHQFIRELLLGATEEQIKMTARYELERMKDMDAYIGLRAGENTGELSDVPGEKMRIYSEHYMAPVHIKERVANTKWCVLRYPNYSMAQAANKSIDAFEDFYFNVCNLDYEKMDRAMDAMVELMNKTDRVRITGTGTDLSFSIKNIGVVKCAGKRNIPDGEIYTAPVKDSVKGYITYNTPSLYQGFTYENIRLDFKDGKIIKATANDTEKINNIFDTDEGARYIGEFALGVNPYILTPMKDTLFDEKIMGSFHFTPGNAYKEADNGNISAVHWDLVNIQTPEYGGGEIYFDDKLIRKDGIFVIEELKGLNPDKLK
ncbi:aminopeptidase [Alkaliphilus peptidifermentans]|uniref:Leucyl aminopeptidase (Aminopeptidase T) n=1 Tax=Alkaliphilus peptidifermentans DSM 18978 TaxID=1120976 RepID=A0A1G5LAM8_9FIRM|nr:aminopeptidase [Alkaliphilus peptidifermentans]SCZ09977.1 Leucyl aminopeptidase (aminopeptidase T) [Alkaliphilus peptidifermentans DSM 18978]